MGFRILTAESEGGELDRDFLKKVMELDAEAYSDEYVGELKNMEARYLHNKRTFVCVLDGHTLAGYINFFPTAPALWESILETSPTIRDDDIAPEEILPDYSTKEGENNLYILSVVVREKYRERRDGERPVVDILSRAFIDYLKKLESEGFPINAIAATAVSDDGMRFLSERMFRIVKELDDGNRVFLCDGIYLEQFLNNPKVPYHKSYHDDIYLFLPYADNEKNYKLDRILHPDMTKEKLSQNALGTEEDRLIAQKLLSDLIGNMEYEYSQNIVGELKQNWLGTFQFLHTRDGYEDEEEEGAPVHVVGEEKVYLILLSHEISNTHVLMLFLPDCRYLTSQVEDQLSHGYLKIRRPEDYEELSSGRRYKYMDLNSYLKETYGLLPCGQGKCVLCMSGKPLMDQEFYNILASETYLSVHQDFFIQNDGLKATAETNRAIYDYYDVYMSEAVISLILHDYDEDLFSRIELMATYNFIAELVIFQNAALNKMNQKVARALAQEGDVSYDYIEKLYRDYSKTVKFGQTDNFKYYGTKQEAEQIRQAFSNDELRQTYRDQQEFLEHMVDLNNADRERKSGYIINFAATFLAIMQVRDYVVSLLSKFYTMIGTRFDIEGLNIVVSDSAANTFDVAMLGGSGIFILVLLLLLRRRNYTWRKKLSASGYGGKGGGI